MTTVQKNAKKTNPKRPKNEQKTKKNEKKRTKTNQNERKRAKFHPKNPPTPPEANALCC